MLASRQSAWRILDELCLKRNASIDKTTALADDIFRRLIINTFIERVGFATTRVRQRFAA